MRAVAFLMFYDSTSGRCIQALSIFFRLVYFWMVTFHRLAKGPLREGPGWASLSLSSMRNVADAKLEKTSLSADVPQRVPFVPGPSLRYFNWCGCEK